MRQCPKCAQDIPADAPGGHCPYCAIRGALGDSESNPGATTPHAPASEEFAAPTAEELTALLPQFRVETEVGRGGMGVVYRGTQLNLERPVAIKLLAPHLAADAAFAERFAREARALARLSHPNIVAVYDFGQTSNLPSHSGRGAGCEGSYFYLVMELVDGANLRHVMHGGHIEPKQALEIVPQICDALQYAHDEGIVHRDIKPENILVDKRGRVKIADFGLAKLLGQAPGDVSLTGTQQVMGTLRYMAPEQLGGTKTLDHRADIYSLGVVFYELLTGELPIGRFAPPSKRVQIDVRLDEVVLRALEQEPEERYQHVSELKTEVESVRLNPAPAGTVRPKPELIAGSTAGQGSDVAVGQPFNEAPPKPVAASAATPVAGEGETPAPESRLEAWWLGRSRESQRVINALLCLLCVVGLLGFLSGKQGSEPLPWGGHHTYFKIGLWDPWYRSEWEDGKGGGFALNLWTGSTLFGIACIASIVLALKLAAWDRRHRGTASKRSSGPALSVSLKGSAPSPSSQPLSARYDDRSGPLPRMSRAAVAGAICAPFAAVFGAALWVLVAGKPYLPWIDDIWLWMLLFTLLALGILASLGTAILGGVALTQIRHSAGRLYGLGLALFDVMLFPVMVIDVAAWYGIAVVIRKKLMLQINDVFLTDIGPQVFAVACIVVVDFLLIRAGWRIANAPLPGTVLSAGHPPTKSNL